MAEDKEYNRGSIVDIDRLKRLKEKVKAECLRRNKNGSVEDYGSSTYDFTNEPVVDGIIALEHYNKNAEPLYAINTSNPQPKDSGYVALNDELIKMDAAVSAYAITEMTSQNNDCSAACTGLCLSCSSTCTTGCTGCTGSCTGSCTDRCTGCKGSCSAACIDVCSTGCSSTCTVSCGYNGCAGGCASSCTGAQCKGGCDKACSNCGSNSCSGMCTDAASVKAGLT